MMDQKEREQNTRQTIGSDRKQKIQQRTKK